MIAADETRRELQRTPIPRTRVSSDAGDYCLGFDAAQPFARAELTSRTPETRRSLSIRESRSSLLLPLTRSSSATSSPHRPWNPPEEVDASVCVKNLYVIATKLATSNFSESIREALDTECYLN